MRSNTTRPAVRSSWTACGPPDRVRVRVKDTGVGLSPEYLAQLFQPFNRLGQEARGEEGTGIEAMRILRLDPATAHIPIIALSANAIPRDIEIGLAAGFFRYLTKPIRVNLFLETLNEVMELSGTDGKAAHGVPAILPA
jgi:hypothetical protein